MKKKNKKNQFKVDDVLLVRDVIHIDGRWFKSTVDKVDKNELHFINGETVPLDGYFEITKINDAHRKIVPKKVFELRRWNEHIGYFDTMDDMMNRINMLFNGIPNADFEKFLADFSFVESNKFVVEDD